MIPVRFGPFRAPSVEATSSPGGTAAGRFRGIGPLRETLHGCFGLGMNGSVSIGNAIAGVFRAG